MGGGEMSLLPAIGLFAKFAIRVVDMNRNLGLLDFGSHPEPVLVPLEKLLPDCLLFPYPEIAAPVIFADLKALLHVRLGCLQSKRMRVIDRCDRYLQSDDRADQAQCER